MSLPATRRPALVIALLVGSLGAFGLAGKAAAQMETREGIALQNEILELRRDVQNLQQQIGAAGTGGPPASPYPPGSGPSPTNDALAQLVARVGNLEEAVRQLRGRVEEIGNTVQQQGADLSKRIDDLAFQTQHPQAGTKSGAATAPMPSGPALPMAPPAASPGPKPAAAAPGPTGPVSPQVAQRNPEVALRDAYAAISRRDYGIAEKDAREVLANRTSPRAYEAQFLLAQALLGQRQFSQAAIAYDDAYNRNKKGLYAQESLLGLAESLIAISEKRAACDTLTKMHAQFPNPRPDLHEPIAQATRRAACK